MGRKLPWSRQLITLCVLAVICVLWLSNNGTSKTIIVDDDGESNFITIQDAINASADGDTVRVNEGAYEENVIGADQQP